MDDFKITPGEGTFKVTRANKLTVEKNKQDILQFEKKYEITIRWWRENGKSVPETSEYELESAAMERINEMRREGCSSGQLFYEGFVNDFEEVSFTGWWELKEITQ